MQWSLHHFVSLKPWITHLKLVLVFCQVGDRGRVVGIDHVDELIRWSTDNVSKDKPDLLQSGRVKFVVGDGRQGYAAGGPYNAM